MPFERLSWYGRGALTKKNPTATLKKGGGDDFNLTIGEENPFPRPKRLITDISKWI
jgi:hypothetical protein